MKKIQFLVTAAIAALALAAPSAHADTVWNFSYTGGGVTASGQFDTLGDGTTPTEVQWMTGTYSDGTTVGGSISLYPDPLPGTTVLTTDGLYQFDNLYGGNPVVDYGGIVFVAGGQEVNLYQDPSLGLTSLTHYGAGYVYTPVGFSATAVPEPASVALLMAGLGALGIASRRRVRN